MRWESRRVEEELVPQCPEGEEGSSALWSWNLRCVCLLLRLLLGVLAVRVALAEEVATAHEECPGWLPG